ncbi:MAG: hypothetical protein IJW90_00515, partial [Clostridia bacterium]|nr:hypothetical protein [Clostridia bacterium]
KNRRGGPVWPPETRERADMESAPTERLHYIYQGRRCAGDSSRRFDSAILDDGQKSEKQVDNGVKI